MKNADLLDNKKIGIEAKEAATSEMRLSLHSVMECVMKFPM
jgi:hypothetical protein